MSKVFVYKEKVRMYDVDSQSVVHFSDYYRFFTDCLEEFSMKLFGRVFSDLSNEIFFVTVSSQAEYRHPLHLGDLLRIEMKYDLLSRKSIRFNFKIYRGNEEACEGSLVQVAVDKKTWKSTEIPAWVMKKLR